MTQNEIYTLGIDIGSTTVKIAILDETNDLIFSDYERHFANIQETLSDLIGRAIYKLGPIYASPVIPFVQEVIAVSTALQDYAPQTDVAIELGGEDAKIIYFEGGNVEQRMNGVCAGGTGSFIDQMASLLQTDASGLNEYAKIIGHFIPSLQDAVYLPNLIFSPSSMKARPRKTWRHLSFKQWSTRQSVDLPAENRFADMSHS